MKHFKDCLFIGLREPRGMLIHPVPTPPLTLFNLSLLLLVIPPSGPLYTLSRSNLSAHFYKLEALNAGRRWEGGTNSPGLLCARL